MSIRTIMVVQSYHRGGTNVPSWWYDFYIAVRDALSRIYRHENKEKMLLTYSFDHFRWVKLLFWSISQ